MPKWLVLLLIVIVVVVGVVYVAMRLNNYFDDQMQVQKELASDVSVCVQIGDQTKIVQLVTERIAAEVREFGFRQGDPSTADVVVTVKEDQQSAFKISVLASNEDGLLLHKTLDFQLSDVSYCAGRIRSFPWELVQAFEYQARVEEAVRRQ